MARFAILVAVALLVVVLLEMVLQTRLYMRSGQGLIAIVTERTRYRVDAETGLKLLNPRASRPAFRINAQGFRSDDVARDRPSGVVRIAVVGASTVMGELAATNESMFSARLEKKLNSAAKEHRFEVVNAGIAGYRLRHQQMLIDRKIRPLAPDWIIVLPGFNDVSDYCSRVPSGSTPPRRVPVVAVPEWWISFNLVRRMTSFLRPPAPKVSAAVQGFDAHQYRLGVDHLLRMATSAAPHVLVASNGRAFGIEQDPATRVRLAQSAHSHVSCLSLEGLIDLYDVLNREIEQAARDRGLPFLDLASRIPRGAEYFGDATHYSPLGEEFVSRLLFEALAQAGAVVEVP